MIKKDKFLDENFVRIYKNTLKSIRGMKDKASSTYYRCTTYICVHSCEYVLFMFSFYAMIFGFKTHLYGRQASKQGSAGWLAG